MNQDELVKDIFEYHPWNASQVIQGTRVRNILMDAYKTILNVVPDGPDRNTALRKLREVRMDCNSAITHEGKY